MNQIYMLIGGVVVLLSISGVVTFFILKRSKTPHAPSTKTKLTNSLHTEQEKSEIILSSIEDGVILIGSDSTIQLFNSAAAKITGWTQADALTLNHHSVLQFVDEKGTAYDAIQNPFDRVFSEGVPVRDNTGYLKTRSGKVISASVSASPLINAENQIDGAVGIFRDVSEERKEEKQRADFISTASHEMRTPVAAIEGYLALALNDKVSHIDEKARDYLEKAHNSTQHLGQLFQDLLTAAKSEDGRLINHPVVVEVSSFLQEIVEDIRFTAEKKGLGLEFLLGSSTASVNGDNANQKVIAPLYYVMVDPDRMREVITNLFDNAVKYSEMGKISIGLTGDANVVQIRVTDTGQGIPPEDVSHLFQKFYRVDNSATRTIGGTGLGLFISRKIVELYSGRIWVESTLGAGSTFFINLPRLSSAKAEELKLKETTSTPAAPATQQVL